MRTWVTDAPRVRFVVEAFNASGHWHDADWHEDGAPLRFETWREAREAIREHVREARGAGLTDYREADYRAVPDVAPGTHLWHVTRAHGVRRVLAGARADIGFGRCLLWVETPDGTRVDRVDVATLYVAPVVPCETCGRDMAPGDGVPCEACGRETCPRCDGETCEAHTGA